MSFNLEYKFVADKKEVVIQHRAPSGNFQKYLRVTPGNLGVPDAEGGTGPFARFRIHKQGDMVRIESLKNPGKFLRIGPGDKIDAMGGQGPLTLFKVKSQGGGVVKLESNKFPGKYLAVKPKGVDVGSGGKWCDFQFKREGAAAGGGSGGAFNAAYMFAKNNTVVIMHQGGGSYSKFLRNMDGTADPNGGKGNLAQWEVTLEGGDKIRLKSKKSGKYLRIKQDGEVDVQGGLGPFTVFKVQKMGKGPNGGSKVKLESVKVAGKYIAIGQNNKVRSGAGGKWCELQFFRN